jgi:hypothetical protein
VRRALVGVLVLFTVGMPLGCKSSSSSRKDAGGGAGGGGGGGGAGGSGGNGPDGGAISIETTATQIAAAICPKAYLCCTAQQLVTNSSAGMTEAECELNTTDLFRSVLESIQTSQDAQRCRYEQSKVDACLNTIRTSTCGMLNVTNHLSGVPNCASFTTPLVATGGVCSQSFECTYGVCQKSSGADEGTCGPGVAAGQSCTVNVCAPGLICDPRDPSDTIDDVCAQPLADGTTCTDAVQCRSGNCAAPASGGAATCMTGNQCFYSSACAAAGGPPTPASLLLAGMLAAFAARRSRRRRR